MPPQFDPESDTPAGDLLQERLDLYTAQRPDIRIETRVKASSGTGGLLDSLSSANAAAPLVVPDLILLPRTSLEIAALKGLLFPYDGLTDTLDESDWYPYAQELGQIQTSTFGLPFAGNALVSLYRPSEIETLPLIGLRARKRSADRFPRSGRGSLFPACSISFHWGADPGRRRTSIPG